MPTPLRSSPIAGLIIAASLLAACAATPPATPATTPAATMPAAATRVRASRPPLTSGVIDTNALRSETTSSGSRQTVFNGPTATLQNFESHISTVLPGQSAHAPHTHPHEEMLIVKEGVLEVTINGKTQRAGPGAIIFYAPNDPHGTKSVGDVPAVYYVFTWVTDETQQPDVTKPYAPAP
ncbi:MAG TPA: cupin domain-containing protein [Opitutales bacterium]|nr:cupin domain-containing protein [Opitutales bacterium]